MALYTKMHGVKPAARALKVTPKTIRKCLTRFDGQLASLDEHSRAPHKRPRKLGKPAQAKILAASRQAPRFVDPRTHEGCKNT
jgi:hypothetical protein